MKITFEGAPAVGKSTVSKALKINHHCHLIPEVNVLFGKKGIDSHLDYYQKQVERWKRGYLPEPQASITIFDGDIFQPIWFSYLFSHEDWGCFNEMNAFYLKMLQSNQLSFPDKYVYFYTDENIRAARETNRSKLRKKRPEEISRKIQRYSHFAVQQYDFFKQLEKSFPGLVVFIKSDNILDSMNTVLSLSGSQSYRCLDIFQFILAWGKARLQLQRANSKD